MGGATITVRALGEPGDLGWVVMAHGEQYAREFGWNGAFEALVARIVADHTASATPEAAAAWIAEADGRRVGCVFCVAATGEDPSDDGPDRGPTAQLRLLLVDPSVRGRGVGGRLLDECLAFASSAGYRRIRLWTNTPLTAARSLYLARGFRLTRQDDEPYHTFGPALLGQVYERELPASAPADPADPADERAASTARTSAQCAGQASRPGRVTA
jgi:GNAT superfamily N-acetyltransferase